MHPNDGLLVILILLLSSSVCAQSLSPIEPIRLNSERRFSAQTVQPANLTIVAERHVQFRSVNFQTGVIELFNFDSADIDLSGWRLCSHDFDERRRYTSPVGLSGVTIEAGTSLFVHLNDDAPAGDADAINRSALGDDTLTGGEGNDELHGGSGTDTATDSGEVAESGIEISN